MEERAQESQHSTSAEHLCTLLTVIPKDTPCSLEIPLRTQKSFATFQALILLSYCEVLRKRGVLQETLDPIIQHIGGRQCDRRRLLNSALWINGVIVALVSHGWTIYRATELFFIAGWRQQRREWARGRFITLKRVRVRRIGTSRKHGSMF